MTSLSSSSKNYKIPIFLLLCLISISFTQSRAEDVISSKTDTISEPKQNSNPVPKTDSDTNLEPTPDKSIPDEPAPDKSTSDKNDSSFTKTYLPIPPSLLKPELEKPETIKPPTSAEIEEAEIEEQNQVEEESETPQDKSQEEIHTTDSIVIQVQLVLLLLTLISGYLLRQNKIYFIHETGLALIYGFLAGLIILAVTSFQKNTPDSTSIHHKNQHKNKHEQNENQKSVGSVNSLYCNMFNPDKIPGEDTQISSISPMIHPNYTIAIQVPTSISSNITNPSLSQVHWDESNLFTYKLLGKVNEAESARFDAELKKITFDAEIFFQLLLPPIIFYAAYSMRKRHFFRNIGAILTYAFIGTLIATFVTASIVYTFVIFDHATFNSLEKFTFDDCLYFGAIISATDPVTVLAVFQQKKVNVDLDAMLFGESILNDAVAIVLARAIKEGRKSTSVESVSKIVAGAAASASSSPELSPVAIIITFLGVFSGSMVIGVMFGIVNALAFKHKPLKSEPIVETSMFVLISWSAYLTAEAVDCSGIVSVLFAGIVQAQYTKQNLSPESKQMTDQFFHLLSYIAENFVFCYMGLTMATSNQHSWSVWFIVGSLIAIVVGRACNIYPLSFLLNLGRGKKIEMKTQHMMMWSGLRGAMAFALAIRDTLSVVNQTIFTTTLLICYLTVWILGGGTNHMLTFLKIETNVDPDADLGGERSWTEQTGMFKLWSKLDKKYMKKWFTNVNEDDAKDRNCILDGEISSSRSSSFSNRLSGASSTRMHVPSGAVPLEEDLYDEEVIGATVGVAV